MIFKGNRILVEKGNPGVICIDKADQEQEYVTIRSLVPYHSPERMEEILNSYLRYDQERRNKFCGVCGEKTQKDNVEDCYVCCNCNEKFFPSVFPAIIVSVNKDDKILLAHNVNFPDNLYSVIAGFVDQGESLEECVAREVFEEVGLKVKNIKYKGSQFWSFTTSLMIGFSAEYESGEIKVDGKEINNAAWFKKDELPNIPSKISMARVLIDDFLDS